MLTYAKLFHEGGSEGEERKREKDRRNTEKDTYSYQLLGFQRA